jgi:arylsulfatase A-like enzyme
MDVSSRFTPSWSLVVTGLLAGLVTGVGEVGLLGFKFYILQEFLTVSHHAVWMVPTVNAMLFTMLGLGLALAHRLLPRIVTWFVGLVTLVALMVFTWISMFERIHLAAAALLGLGAGVQLARALRPRRVSLERTVRMLVWRLGALLLVVSAGMLLRDEFRERRALARLEPASPGSPNILLIILDTVRGESLSLYGYPRSTTPEISRWAAGGVVFDRAFSEAPWTLPSHASMFTGHHAHELKTSWNTPLEREPPTLASVLSARGYSTAGFVANVRYCGRETGLARGFSVYHDYRVDAAEAFKITRLTEAFHSTVGRKLRLFPVRPRTGALEIRERFTGWLDQRDTTRPFFVFLNFLDAHAPYQPPSPFRERFERRPGVKIPNITADRANNAELEKRFTPDEARASRDLYDGAIAYLDSEIGALLRQMNDRGLLENTIVILTSDHGEAFAEQGLLGHANSLYRPTLQVPLVISWPGHLPAGTRIDQPVSLRDIAATLADLTSGPADFPGRSLRRFWDGSARSPEPPLIAHLAKLINQPSWWPASPGEMFSVNDGRYRYIRNQVTGNEELFDFVADRDEQHDLAKTPEGIRQLPAYREMLQAFTRVTSRH